jgi:hypothetical protein
MVDQLKAAGSITYDNVRIFDWKEKVAAVFYRAA